MCLFKMHINVIFKSLCLGEISDPFSQEVSSGRHSQCSSSVANCWQDMHITRTSSQSASWNVMRKRAIHLWPEAESMSGGVLVSKSAIGNRKGLAYDPFKLCDLFYNLLPSCNEQRWNVWNVPHTTRYTFSRSLTLSRTWPSSSSSAAAQTE